MNTLSRQNCPKFSALNDILVLSALAVLNTSFIEMKSAVSIRLPTRIQKS